jgi:hypothetical protein
VVLQQAATAPAVVVQIAARVAAPQPRETATALAAVVRVVAPVAAPQPWEAVTAPTAVVQVAAQVAAPQPWAAAEAQVVWTPVLADRPKVVVQFSTSRNRAPVLDWLYHQ